jgi:hypothetical protein
MSLLDSMSSLTTDATVTVSRPAESDAALEPGVIAGVGELCRVEHPAVMGGRVGACLFSSFAFPVILYVLGAVDVTAAALIAAVATLLFARPILLLGGLRIARVLTLQIALAGLALSTTFHVIPALLLAGFLPLLGMLAFVSASSRLAAAWFARDDRPYEADVVIARATQSTNVVDIRAAGIARRSATKAQAVAVSDSPAAADESHQQAK